MYDQLPMQVSLMERERERKLLVREAEVWRALGGDPLPRAGLARAVAAARGLMALLRPKRGRGPAGAGVAHWRPELESGGAA